MREDNSHFDVIGNFVILKNFIIVIIQGSCFVINPENKIFIKFIQDPVRVGNKSIQ